MIATATPPPGSLQRMVRWRHLSSSNLTRLAEGHFAPSSQMLQGLLFGVTILNMILKAAPSLVNDRSHVRSRLNAVGKNSVFTFGRMNFKFDIHKSRNGGSHLTGIRRPKRRVCRCGHGQVFVAYPPAQLAFYQMMTPKSSPAKAAFVLANPKAKLLDQLREVLRVKHYSLRTEEAYELGRASGRE